MVNDLFKTFSINLNVQHVNGMTPIRLLGTLECICNAFKKRLGKMHIVLDWSIFGFSGEEELSEVVSRS